MGMWFSGNWHDAEAEAYMGHVQSALHAKDWLYWG